MMGPGDFVQVVNNGPDTEWQWDGRPYPLPNGKVSVVPFEVMANMVGDPRSGGGWSKIALQDGTTSLIPPREYEVARLRVRHGGSGVVAGRLDDVPNLPNVEVKTLEGDPITTVVDDPTGETVLPSGQTRLEAANTAQALAQQNREIQQLKARLTEMDANRAMQNEPGEDDATDVPSDE